MSESSVLARIKAMPIPRFKQVCQKIVNGLGFVHANEIPLLEIPAVFEETIERRSTDRMFHTRESWLLAFIRSSAQTMVKGLEAAVQAAEIAEAQNILVVIFGSVDSANAEKYFANASKVELRSVLLTDSFAQILLHDYAADEFGPIECNSFSFARLRQRMKQQSQHAVWREQFLSLTALPIHASKVYRKEAEGGLEETESLLSILNEADLFGAIYKSSSFLLLADPGAGKTTCLQELAEELASVGARTPVFLPLNRYDGNLLGALGEVLCGEANQLSEQEIESLLSSGALTVILDGLNEVQSQALRSELVKEINALTNPETPMARSQWIASSRRYDYSYAPQLTHLDRHIWELLPLDSSLIYQFLERALGETEGKAAYFDLGQDMREVCSNPLLLNMLLTVYEKRGKLSTTRGALYYQFVDLLLRKGAVLDKYQEDLVNLSRLLGFKLTIDKYCSLAHSVLADLAEKMQDDGILAVGTNEIINVFKRHKDTLIPGGLLPEKAAIQLYQKLSDQGLLRYENSKVVFLHHTFQEYFYAVKLREQPLDKLIPRRGIPGAKREAIVFMASTLVSVNALDELIDRILSYADDVDLAYEIIRSASIPPSEARQLNVAQYLWNRVNSGTFVGANKRSAQMLMTMAAFLHRSVEQLLRDIHPLQSERGFLDVLLRLYQEIGDVAAQQRLVKNIDSQEDIPDDLLFKTAATASSSGDRPKAIELYTQYIKKVPGSGVAYNNRAIVYQAVGNLKQAEEDYRQAISISPTAVNRTNYAQMLIADGRKEQALEELKLAIGSSGSYYRAHLELSELLDAESSPQALFHLETAVKFAPNPDEQTICLKKLLAVQEKLGYLASAMISIKRLIDLNPTSYQVSQWKEKFAHLRSEYIKTQKYEEIQTYKVGSREVSLVAQTRKVLDESGYSIDKVGLLWIRAVSDRPGLISPLQVLLLDVPQLTETLVQERITELQSVENTMKCIVLLTTAEILDREARMYLAQCPFPVALIASSELNDSITKGEQHCSQLLTNAINRADKRGNPFRYMKMIQECEEFFGRKEQKEDFTSLILRHELIALYGIHKIGKSSFLRQVCLHLGEVYKQRITPVWVEMNASLKKPEDLYREILRELNGNTKKFEQEALSKVQFRDELYAIWKDKRHDYATHQILLILDEYPYLIPGRSGEHGMADYEEVLGLFKKLYEDDASWFNFLPCGRTTALSRVARWPGGVQNPFIGMFQERFLGPLTREEVEDLLNVLGSKVGLKFGEDVTERIWTLAGGHPLFTRTLGSWILERCNSSPFGSSVSVSMVDDAVKIFLRSSQDTALLKKIYQEELEDEEQRIVKILATSGRPLPRAALIPDNPSEANRRKTRAAVDNLLATSVLSENSQRCLSHRYELLRLVILQDIEDDRLYEMEHLAEPSASQEKQDVAPKDMEKPRPFFSALRHLWDRINS
jgi:tetratricopeptide (TPR) repeat protein